MATGRPFQLVVFGASGFTGQFVVEELARVAAEDELRGSVRWAVAGRDKQKLQAVLERAAEKLGEKRRVGGSACGGLPSALFPGSHQRGERSG